MEGCKRCRLLRHWCDVYFGLIIVFGVITAVLLVGLCWRIDQLQTALEAISCSQI